MVRLVATQVDSVDEREESKHATQHFYRHVWVGAFSCNCIERGRAGKASANAHRRLFVRQLSVQHSEGREPSRIRTET